MKKYHFLIIADETYIEQVKQSSNSHLDIPNDRVLVQLFVFRILHIMCYCSILRQTLPQLLNQLVFDSSVVVH